MTSGLGLEAGFGSEVRVIHDVSTPDSGTGKTVHDPFSTMTMEITALGQLPTSSGKCGTADRPYLDVRAGGSRPATERSGSSQAEEGDQVK